MLAGYDHLITAARRLQWDEAAITLDGDRAGFAALDAGQRARLSELVTGFWVAEHAVAQELSPFMAAAGCAGRSDAPAARECFALQARDEARHARFFDRVAAELLALDGAAARAAAPASIRELFEAELPAVARALARCGEGTGPTEQAGDHLAAAVGLYHLVLEGIVFAVGQDALLELCDEAHPPGLPGLRAGVARVQGDERWHVGLGVLALQRLGGPGDLTRLAGHAAQACAAWGPGIATPQRIAHVTATHQRRLRIITTSSVVAVESTV